MTQHDGRKLAGSTDDVEAKSAGLTRREWILRLGEAAVLAGFSGVAADGLTSPESLTVPDTASSIALPPGLYDPSGEHMAHVLFRDSRFITPPPGSETEYAVARTASAFEPAFFSQEDFKVARRLVVLVLNSRAGGEAGSGLSPVDEETADEIAEWIDLTLSQAAATREAAKKLSAQHRELAIHYHDEEAVRRLETSDPEKGWKEGLAWLEAESHKTFNQGFPALTEVQQVQLLDSIGDLKSNANRETAGTGFYRLLKNATIRGYYTSRAGLKELDYKGNAFYPESPGCPNK